MTSDEWDQAHTTVLPEALRGTARYTSSKAHHRPHAALTQLLQYTEPQGSAPPAPLVAGFPPSLGLPVPQWVPRFSERCPFSAQAGSSSSPGVSRLGPGSRCHPRCPPCIPTPSRGAPSVHVLPGSCPRPGRWGRQLPGGWGRASLAGHTHPSRGRGGCPGDTQNGRSPGGRALRAWDFPAWPHGAPHPFLSCLRKRRGGGWAVNRRRLPPAPFSGRS